MNLVSEPGWEHAALLAGLSVEEWARRTLNGEARQAKLDEQMVDAIMATLHPEESALMGSPWYFVEGVRYCSHCRTRRCVLQNGELPCISAAR